MTRARPTRPALLLVALLATAGSARAAGGGAEPPPRPTLEGDTIVAPEANRFQQEVLSQGGLDEPTELAVLGDGRVFFIERKGALKVYEPRTRQTRQLARLEVNHESENGLIGLALDPSFERTGWLYLNYSVAGALKHRVSRFTLAADTLADERVLLEVPFTQGCCHTGGSMTFDGRGNLLVSFGDNTNPFNAGSYAPIDPTPGRELMDARRSSANTQDLRGKILRITPQPDGSYTIPAGNLFPHPWQGRPEIYTMGHRNPYRISVDRRTGFLYWGEVGPDARVDSVYGPKGYDEVNQARRAGNFGWPMFIADNKPYRDFNFTTKWRGELFDPARPVNRSPNTTGDLVLPPAQPAFIFYPYDQSPEFPLVGEGGRNAMAGPVFYHDDFPDSGLKLPRHYDGKFIHYDWIRGWMMAVTMDAQGNFARMEPFLSHLKFDHPIDVELGPEGALYVLEYGTFWFAKNPTARLSRIVYHAGNRPPLAALRASRTVGAAPLTVELSAAGSMDHDPGDALRFSWRIGESQTAEGATVTHTLTEPGTYPVRLTVRDASGAVSEATTEIRVGNAPPEVRVAVSGNRSFFWDNAPLNYHVEVSDAEDGRLGGGIDPQRVRVTLDYQPRAVVEALAEAGHQTERTPVGLALMRESDCTGCHAEDQESVGPAYRRIAERYAGRPDALATLAAKVIAGGGGAWGDRVMPAHPGMRQDVAREMVRYILSLASGGTVLPPSGTLRLDQHKAGESGAYTLTAAYVDQARNGIGPLETRAEVVLRAPLLRAGNVARTHLIGTAAGKGSDGAERPIATVYGDGAYLHLGRTDLTGVGQIRFGLQALGHPFSLELRAGGPEGRLLASQAVRPPSAREAWFTASLAPGAEGEHDLFIVLRSPVAELGQWNPLVRVDEIRFQRAAR